MENIRQISDTWAKLNFHGFNPVELNKRRREWEHHSLNLINELETNNIGFVADTADQSLRRHGPPSFVSTENDQRSRVMFILTTAQRIVNQRAWLRPRRPRARRCARG